MNLPGNLWQLKSTYDRFSERVFWPVGTVEAHGPLPVGTDNLSAEYIASKLAGEYGADIIPLFPFGVNRSLVRYKGNLSLSPETFKAVVYDVGLSLWRNGVKELVVINGHGGNTSHLKEALHRLHLDTGMRVAAIDWWVLVPTLSKEVFGEVQGHAGVEEWAFVVTSYPELYGRVDREKEYPAYHPRGGVSVYPAPRSILLYEEGRTNRYQFIEAQLNRYVEGVLKVVKEVLDEIFGGWRSNGED